MSSFMLSKIAVLVILVFLASRSALYYWIANISEAPGVIE